MYKFKLIKKINPQDKSAPKKWYAVPISESPQSFRETARDDFNASSMIKEARVVFTPSKEFREAVTNNIVFGNAGVLEDDINYASLADYRRAKEQSGEGGGTPGEV